MTSTSRLGQDKEENNENNHCYPKGIVYTKCFAIIEEILEFICRFFSDTGCNGIRIAVAVYHIGDTSCHEHSSERCNKWRKLEFAYQITVHYTNYQTTQNEILTMATSFENKKKVS